MGTPFKMKGSPMQRNFGIGSPAKKRDVEIDGELFTGEGAYAKGRIAEAEKKKAWKEGTEAGQSKQALAQNVRVSKARQTKITYTGDDAHKRINESSMSAKEKTAAHAKVRAGGSYSG